MKTATFIKYIEGWRGDARLYELSEPVEYGDCLWDEDAALTATNYVIVSAVVFSMFAGPETFIFPAREDGTAIDMIELRGSMRGNVSHEKVLERAGYTVT